MTDAAPSDARWPIWGNWAVAGAALALVLAAAAALFWWRPWASAPSPAERAQIEAVVHDYLLAHPEILPQAIQKLQERQVAQIIEENRDAIETPFGSAWAGAKDADVVLVEFFDYNCPYCRLSYPDVERLLKEDSKLKVVYRDFPVLGEASREAALASLSAAEQGRYKAFYDRMFTNEARLSTEKTVATVRAAKLDEAKTAADMKSDRLKPEIQRNLALGQALGISGTPTYIIGDQMLSGAVGYEALKAAIAKARARS
jgi:protein-disulfide isomerase